MTEFDLVLCDLGLGETLFLSWPECARLCKSTTPLTHTELAFHWAHQTDHAVRRFLGSQALPDLQKLTIFHPPGWARGPGAIWCGLEERGRSLCEMVIVTYVNLGKTRWVRLVLSVDDVGHVVLKYDCPREPLRDGELQEVIHGLGLDQVPFRLASTSSPPMNRAGQQAAEDG